MTTPQKLNYDIIICYKQVLSQGFLTEWRERLFVLNLPNW